MWNIKCLTINDLVWNRSTWTPLIFSIKENQDNLHRPQRVATNDLYSLFIQPDSSIVRENTQIKRFLESLIICVKLLKKEERTYLTLIPYAYICLKTSCKCEKMCVVVLLQNSSCQQLWERRILWRLLNTESQWNFASCWYF